jgi:hypothetical protein
VGIDLLSFRDRVELLACWRGQFGRHCNFEVWKMIPLWLMWCIGRECNMWHIWRECNARKFEDCERTATKLKAIMLKSLYICMAFDNYSHFSNFMFCALIFFLIGCFSCMHPVYIGCTPLCFFARLDDIKKENMDGSYAAPLPPWPLNSLTINAATAMDCCHTMLLTSHHPRLKCFVQLYHCNSNVISHRTVNKSICSTVRSILAQ